MEIAIRMMTQLNLGMSGVIGLRYEALPVLFDCMSVTPGDRLETLDALRVIEQALVQSLNQRS